MPDMELTPTVGGPAFLAEAGDFLAAGVGAVALGSTPTFAVEDTARIDFAGPSIVLATVVPAGLALPDSSFRFAPVAVLATPAVAAVLVCMPTPDAPTVF